MRLYFDNRKFEKATAELHPIPKVWHTIGVDLIGPLPQTAQGNYIVTASCFFFEVA